MERPTKPVIWTDEKAHSRLISWLTNDGWVSASRQPYQVIKMNRTREACQQSIQWFDTNVIIGIEKSSELYGLTLDSLLHDINIIKPIGRLEYTSEWIDKILSGQKTMDILPIQYMCGYYELWDTERQEVRGIVEVMDVSILRFRIEKNNLPSFSGVFQYNAKIMAQKCGFKMFQDFITHHRTNFQSVKYAITYRVVDMKGDGE
jgi:hypothetical protein